MSARAYGYRDDGVSHGYREGKYVEHGTGGASGRNRGIGGPFTRGTYRLRACAGCCPGIALVSGGRGIRGRSFLEWEYGKCLCPGVTGRKRGEWRKCYSHVETLHGLRGA